MEVADVPLLNGKKEEVADYPPVNSLREAASVFWVESVKLWTLAAPIVFNILCQFGTSTLTIIFVGHIGDLELSAVTIATSVIGTFAFGFMFGMGSALETLCGQAYGAGQIHMLGVYTQRSCIILLTTCLVILPIYIFAGPLLKLIGQDPDIADLAGKYTILIIPQLFSLAINFPTSKFLQAQSKVNVMAWLGLVAIAGHALLLWLFISVFGWGIVGAAVSYNIAAWVIALGQVVYIFGWCRDAWSGFSVAAFNEIWSFVRLSLASAVMLCLEIWYMMGVNLLAGHLNNAVIAVGSLSICTSVNGLQGMIFIGLNAAISVRVSNELGWGRPRAAKYSVYVSVFQSLLIGLLCMVVILVARDHFAVIFTDSVQLQKAVAKLAWLLGITMVLNSVQPVISGVAVGGGWQSLVAYINLICYYVLGLPLACVLGYVAHLGVEGIWGGFIGGVAIQTVVLLFILYKTNWIKEVEKTSDRMREWGGQDIPTKRVEDNTGISDA